MRTRPSPPATVLVLGAIGSVQIGGALARLLFGRIGPGGTVLLRLVTAAAVLLLLVRPRIGRFDRAQLQAAGAFGLILAGMNLAFYEALARIPLGVTVTIEFTGPLAVAVASSRRVLDAGWVLLAGLGVLTLTTGGGRLNLVGALLAGTAGALWAAYILVNQRVGRLFGGLDGLTVAMVVAAVVTAPYGVAAGGSGLLHPGVIAMGAAVGLLSSAIPYSLELAALRRLPRHAFGVLMSLEPAVAALAGLVILGQVLQLRQTLGIVLVCAASAGVTATGRRSRPGSPTALPSAELIDG